MGIFNDVVSYKHLNFKVLHKNNLIWQLGNLSIQFKYHLKINFMPYSLHRGTRGSLNRKYILLTLQIRH